MIPFRGYFNTAWLGNEEDFYSDEWGSHSFFFVNHFLLVRPPSCGYIMVEGANAQILAFTREKGAEIFI